MKLKLSLIMLACVLSGMFLTGCSGDTSTPSTPSTNAAPKTN